MGNNQHANKQTRLASTLHSYHRATQALMQLKGVFRSLEIFDFRTTRSGRPFSSWGPITTPDFSVVNAVTSIALEPPQEEDLGQPDSLHVAISPTPPPVFTPPPPATDATTSQSRDKLRSKLRRAKARLTAKESRDPLKDPPPHKHLRHIIRGSTAPIHSKIQLAKTRITAPGWLGLQGDKGGDRGVHTLDYFFGPNARRSGFTLVKAPESNQPRPVVDVDKKVYAVYGSMPEDANFKRDVHDPAVAALEAARHLRLSPQSNPAFIRLAGFATGLFANWAPNVFSFYIDYMSDFYARYPDLLRPFKNSIWSACTFNLGPRTYTLGHRDSANLAFGWCAITALGHFDYTKGGHLILWDSKLILEFPPGCTILVPSAAIFHSNITVGVNETRYSFTQYTAGGLFRWVEHDFKSELDYFAGMTADEVEKERLLGLQRAVVGAGLFSTLDELLEED
ncbi:hypothetical protein R3P38DRAFT_3172988 [Favolaschia claudopus]|uniref:Uncharacterized protein n=1 Tax=Favolaschia claudopus TaxID=2862362 RepID=A0AAW0DLW4_9AGAR